MTGADRRARAPRRGFTLLETLVAVGIFSLIAVAGAASVRFAHTSQEAAQNAGDRLAALMAARAVMRADFDQAIARPTQDPFGADRRPAFLGGAQILDGVLFAFVHGGWENPLGAARPTLQHVSYEMAEGAFVRVVRPRLDPTQDTPETARRLIDGVSDVRVRFFSGGTWFDRWGVRDGGGAVTDAGAPEAVELVMTIEGVGRVRQIFLVGGPS